jgi:hypothetical protein
MSDFEYHGHSGDWTATSSDCEGWGRTRRAARQDALRQRRATRDDGAALDREAGIVRDEFGFAVPDGPACDCDDGPDADERGICRVCGGHD